MYAFSNHQGNGEQGVGHQHSGSQSYAGSIWSNRRAIVKLWGEIYETFNGTLFIFRFFSHSIIKTRQLRLDSKSISASLWEAWWLYVFSVLRTVPSQYTLELAVEQAAPEGASAHVTKKGALRNKRQWSSTARKHVSSSISERNGHLPVGLRGFKGTKAAVSVGVKGPGDC